MKLNKLITSVLFIVLLFLTSESVFAQANGIGGNLGAGIMLGEPSGVTLKKWNNQRSAFDIGVAWSFSGNNDALLLQGDYLIHNWFNDIDEGRLAWYYGISSSSHMDSGKGGFLLDAPIPEGNVHSTQGLASGQQ